MYKKINKKTVDCGVDIQLISPGDEVILLNNTDEVDWKRMYLNKVAHKKNVDRNMKNNHQQLKLELKNYKEEKENMISSLRISNMNYYKRLSEKDEMITKLKRDLKDYEPFEKEANRLSLKVKDLEDNIEYLNDKCNHSIHKDEGNDECDMWIEEATKLHYLSEELKEEISLVNHKKDIEINKLKEKIEELEKIGQTKNEHKYKKMLEGNRKKYNYMLAKLNNLKKCSTSQEVMLLMEGYDGRGNRLSEHYEQIEKNWIEVKKLYEIMAEFYEREEISLKDYVNFAFEYGDDLNSIINSKDNISMRPNQLDELWNLYP